MDAYQRAVRRSRARLRGLLGAPGARERCAGRSRSRRCSTNRNAPFYKWFEDGELNASYNCLDRHLESGSGDKIAIIFEADDGKVTQRHLPASCSQRVCRFANALKARGVKKGDRVVIYMPMSIEGVVAMQACARIGATHSVVFGGFSAQERCSERIVDAGAVAVITADEQMRGGKELPLKAIVDEALALGGCEAIKNVIVYKRTGGKVAMERRARPVAARPRRKARPTTCEPEWVERRASAVHPLHLGLDRQAQGRAALAPAATCCGPR